MSSNTTSVSSTLNVNPIDLEDPKDSLIVQEETESPLSTNIYELNKYVDALKSKYINIPDDTLTMGLFGYISELGSNILENAAIMGAEYSNEASPTKAKFARNVICHALSLGIDSIRATPAKMNVYIGLPEDRVIANMSNGEFILDKNIDISIGTDTASYKYHLDYDIKLKRNLLPSGKYIYTATYLMDTKYTDFDVNTNEIDDTTNPYLPAVGVINVNNTNILLINTTIRQTTHTVINKKILVNNPLENRSISFSFTDQLAYFYVEVTEHTDSGDVSHYLKCLYDGLYNSENSYEYCNYQYLDDSNIRITFNRDSYQPTRNSDVAIHVYTTKGDECNFEYNKTTQQNNITSNTYTYNKMYMIIMPISNSDYGVDQKSVEELHQIIPKQMMMRNSISTYTDLNNYFNSLNTGTMRLYFLQKIHNEIQRLFFCYMLLKDENNNIIPTNTLDVVIPTDMFSNINRVNYVLSPGATFFLDKDGNNEATGVTLTDNYDLKAEEDNGFLYINPFLIVINKSPFILNYYLTILNYTKAVNFDYINSDSELQFVATSTSTNPVTVQRPFYPKESRDTYTISVTFTQNISTDFGLIDTADNGTITRNNIRVIGVIYIQDDNSGEYKPYRYMEGKLSNDDYDAENYAYTYRFTLKSNNIIDKNIRMCITDGLYYSGTTNSAVTYLPSNVKFKIFVLAKFDEQYGTLIADNADNDDISSIVPGLDSDKYTLCNIYEVVNGLDIFMDYTNIMESYTTLSNNQNGSLDFHVKRMPLVRYSYFWNFGVSAATNTSQAIEPYGMNDRVHKFLEAINRRRVYIQSMLTLLEDSFGIDMKLFNTYGPSKLYNVSYNNTAVPLDRINISLKFEVKYQTASDKNCANDIIAYIKTYMENLNYISDLHMPNLITAVKNKFYKQIVYIKFIGLNDYGYIYQSIYKNTTTDDFLTSTTVPEFININIAKDDQGDDTPDIQIISVD